MEELEKVATPMTVRQYLNTLSDIEFSAFLYHCILQLQKKYASSYFDDFDVELGIECDFSAWLASSYCKDKKLLPSEKIEINEDEFDIEDLDD